MGFGITLTKFGFNKFKKAIRKADQELTKAGSKLLKKIALTAQEKATQMAPRKTGNYLKTIKGILVSKIRSRLQSSRSGVGMGHGYLAGILEYGRKPDHKGARPHLEQAVDYAMKVHEREINTFLFGNWKEALKDFGG